MKKTILIEIINDTKLAIYWNKDIESSLFKGAKQIITDDELKNFVDYNWFLIDPINSFAKVFDHKATEKIKDNNLLTQIISAHFESLLINERNSYIFTWKNKLFGKFWAVWIEKNKLQNIQERFDKYKNNIISLSNSSLFFANILHQITNSQTNNSDNSNQESTLYIHNSPFVYMIEQNQCSCFHETNFDFNNKQVLKIEDIYEDINHNLKKSNISKTLPNLLNNSWAKNSSQSNGSDVFNNLPINWWFAGLSLALLAVFTTQLIKVKSLKNTENAIYKQQTDILKQAVPDAKPSQPYSRLKAEYAQQINTENDNGSLLDSFDKFNLALNKQLEEKKLQIVTFSIDHKNNYVEVGFEKITKEQKISLTNYLKKEGFNVDSSNKSNNEIGVNL